MATLIQWRRDVATNWTTANPTLAQGEAGFELDTYQLKIGDGVTPWNSLAYFGGSGTTIQNAESVATYAVNPTQRLDGTPLQEGDIYYNTIDDSLYTYNGTAWVQLGASSGGASTADQIRAAAAAPTTDLAGNALAAGDVYYNTVDGVTYVYTGSAWEPIASGTSSVQSLAAAPTPAAAGDVYYDTVTNEMYFYDGTDWTPVGETDSITQTPSTNPVVGDTYYDVATGDQYIYNGTDWVSTESGEASSFWTAPIAPTTDPDGNALVEGAAYFNSIDDTLYVYDGSQWIAAGGTTTSILAAPTAPSPAALGDIYYNTVTNEQYVYDGTSWTLVDDGNAESIRTAATAPSTATDGSALEVGDVYYNTGNGITYVYNGATWEPIAAGTTSYYTAVADPTGATEGDTYYNSVTNEVMVYDGTAWVPVDSNTTITTTAFNTATGVLTINDSDSVAHTTNLDGRYPTIGDMNVAISQTLASQIISDLADVDTATVPPTPGQILKWNGTNWVPGNDITAGGAGLDADTLDGFDSTYYLNYNNLANTPVIPTVISDMTDVDTAGAAQNFVLKYDSVAGKWVAADLTTFGTNTLASLTDTDITAPINGNVLVYNGTTGDWVPASPAAAFAVNLNDLGDVNTAGAVQGSIIQYNSATASWVVGAAPTFTETTTTLALNGTSLDYVDEVGNTTNIDLSVFAEARITSGTVAGNNLTLVRDDGSSFVVDVTALNNAETVTALVDNGDGTLTYTDELGAATTVAVGGTETVTTFVDNGNGTYTYTSEDGTVTTTAAPGAETVTTLVDNGDNTLSYTNEAGTVVTIDLTPYLDDTNLARLTSGTLDAVTGIATFTRDDTTTFTVDFSSLIDVETTTTLVDNGDGSFTYTSEDATVTTYTAPAETVTTFVDNGNGTYTYTSEDGTTTTTAAPGAETVTTLVDNGDGTFTYTSENATATTITVSGGLITSATAAGVDYQVEQVAPLTHAPSATTRSDGTALVGGDQLLLKRDTGIIPTTYENTMWVYDEASVGWVELTNTETGFSLPDGQYSDQRIHWNDSNQAWELGAPLAMQAYIYADDLTANAAFNAGPGVTQGTYYWNTTDKEMRVWTSSAWEPIAPNVINDLDDVDTASTAPTDGQALVWNATNSMWEPATVGGALPTGTSDGDRLLWNNTTSAWVATPAIAYDIAVYADEASASAELIGGSIGGGDEGRIYYNNSDDLLYTYDGTQWNPVGGGGSIPDGTAFGQMLWWSGGAWSLSPDYATAGFEFDGYTGTFLTDQVSHRVITSTQNTNQQLDLNKAYHQIVASAATTIQPDQMTAGINKSSLIQIDVSNGAAVTFGNYTWIGGAPTLTDGTHFVQTWSNGTTVYAQYVEKPVQIPDGSYVGQNLFWDGTSWIASAPKAFYLDSAADDTVANQNWFDITGTTTKNNGSIYYNTTDDVLKVYDADLDTWTAVGGGSGGSGVYQAATGDTGVFTYEVQSTSWDYEGSVGTQYTDVTTRADGSALQPGDRLQSTYFAASDPANTTSVYNFEWARNTMGVYGWMRFAYVNQYGAVESNNFQSPLMGAFNNQISFQNAVSSLSVAANTTFTVNAFTVPSGMVGTTSMIITISNNAVITWPAAVKWAGGSAPTLANGTHILNFMTTDSGANVYATASTDFA